LTFCLFSQWFLKPILKFMRQTELALLGDGFRKVPVPSDA
jgi:hypothetical protein